MTAREALPMRRGAVTFDAAIAGQVFAVTVDLYPDGRTGEVFVSAPKVGSDIEAILRDGAILMSFALQHGAPLDELLHAMTRDAAGEVSSMLGRLAQAVADLKTEVFLRLAHAT
jgi:hypothetical protein